MSSNEHTANISNLQESFSKQQVNITCNKLNLIFCQSNQQYKYYRKRFQH